MEQCEKCRNADGEWCVAHGRNLKFIDLSNCFYFDTSVLVMSFKDIVECNDSSKKKEAIDILIQRLITDKENEIKESYAY